MFYSLQGEGARSGTANVFVRFSGCNLACNLKEHGFDCDTEFVSGRSMSMDYIYEEADRIRGKNGAKAVIWTGGEPGLQLDDELVTLFRTRGWYQSVETNGTKELPTGLDWVSCSPKTAEHTLALKAATELRYVRRQGMGIPKPSIDAAHYFISPGFQPDGSLDSKDLGWCIRLAKENPLWRLSVQQHKLWNVR
jgi:organic radical activating enzyme